MAKCVTLDAEQETPIVLSPTIATHTARVESTPLASARKRAQALRNEQV